ncbi:unnamed protein product [Danaus chrysippus]|uniref:(African queen) hypothetical protein n=1 Tax=Danaus chrysippus TaxID=151541 RepID=A0A8J2PZA6_9NEOP|nr:unnamed protein product [Danaus chrysippus]
MDELQSLLMSPPSAVENLLNPEMEQEVLDYFSSLNNDTPVNVEPDPQPSTNSQNLDTLPVSTNRRPQQSLPSKNLHSPNENLPLPAESNSKTIQSTENQDKSPDDDYSHFLKSPTRTYNTTIKEHNESLLKCTQNLIIIPTSIDLDESMPYVQEVFDNCPESTRDEFLKLERDLFTSLPLTFDNKHYLFLFTKIKQLCLELEEAYSSVSSAAEKRAARLEAALKAQ